MVEPQDLGGINPEKVVEGVLTSMAERKAVFNMGRHYWNEVLGREFITEPGFKVVDLGALHAVAAIPFALALSGKTRLDLAMSVRDKPTDLPVKVTSLEINSDAIGQMLSHPLLRIHGQKEGYVQGDFRKLSYADESFDIALFRNPNWRNVKNAGEVLQVFEEIHRVIKPKGLLWMTFLLESEYQVARKAIERAKPPTN